MPEFSLILAIAGFAFLLAGFVKGVLGQGLPTVAVGVLSLIMSPGEAAALVVVPALLTNIWQGWVGPSLVPLLRRLWPTLLASFLCTFIATWAGLGLLTPEAVAGKMPTGLPEIDVDAHAVDSGDPVRRAAGRIVTLDNANMAMTDNTVDVDGKGMEARTGASELQDNVIYSNASLDEAVDTPDEGLGGIESRPSGNMPQIATRPGWRVRHVGDVDIEHGDSTRAEHVICLERSDD